MLIYRDLSDDELTAYLSEGDNKAFEEIYTRFFGLLYIHAFRHLNNPDETNDLLQELFSSIWQRRTSLKLRTNLSAYLYSAVRYQVINVIARKKRDRRYLESLADFTDQDHCCSDYLVREKDLRARIEKEIDALPGQMREIFILSRKKHLSHREIAELHGTTEQAVKSHVKRALKILRLKLGIITFLLFIFNLI